MSPADDSTQIIPPSTPNRERRRAAIFLTLILALAAALRWHGITAAGYSFDELWHLEVANGHGSIFYDLPFDRVIELDNPLAPAHAKPFWQLPSLTIGVTHPPGAFMSLRLWRDLFGDGLLALRSWSAAWSVLSVALLFIAVARSFGRAAGLWAALLLAISLGSIDQAREVRGYSMLQAVTLVAVILLLRLRDATRVWPTAAALGASVFLMVFTHYFSIASCAAIGVGAVALLRGRARIAAVASLAVAGVVWIVWWLPHLRAQLSVVEGTADVFLLDASERPLAATLLRVLAVPYTAIVGEPNALGAAALVGGAIAWLAVAYAVARRGDRAADRWLWLGLAIAAFAPQLVLDLARQTLHLGYPRYMVAAAPPLCALLATLPSIRRLPLPAVAAAALAIAGALTVPLSKPDLRPHLAYLRQHAAPGDLILLPARPARPRDAQARFLSLAYGLPFDRHRIALPVGPQSPAWIDALPRDGRWFCLAFADYDPSTWQPGLAVVDRGPTSSGVAVYEVRRAGP